MVLSAGVQWATVLWALELFRLRCKGNNQDIQTVRSSWKIKVYSTGLYVVATTCLCAAHMIFYIYT